MRRLRIIILAVVLSVALLVAFSVLILRPPANWQKLALGMSLAECDALVGFDCLPPECRFGYKYDYRRYITWSLGVAWKADRAVWIDKELWVHYPKEAPTMIFSFGDKAEIQK